MTPAAPLPPWRQRRPSPNRKPTHGHVVLLHSLSTLVGLRGPDIDGGLAAASELCAKGTPFAYMTLTNDHLPDSEKGHDDTLAWERTNCTGGGGAAVSTMDEAAAIIDACSAHLASTWAFSACTSSTSF